MKKRNVYRYIVFSYFSILLSAYFIFIPTLYGFTKQLEKNAVSSLEGLVSEYDRQIQEVLKLTDDVTEQFQADEKITSLLYQHFTSGADYYKVYQASQNANKIFYHYNYKLENFFIYYPNSRVVLTEGTAYMKVENFLKQYFQNTEQDILDEIMDVLETQNTLNLTLSVENGKYFCVFDSISMSYSLKSKRAIVAYLIPVQQFTSVMEVSAGSGIYIYNEMGECLLCEVQGGTEEHISELIDTTILETEGYFTTKEYLMLQSDYKNKGISSVFLIPTSFMKQKMNQFIGRIIAVTVISLLIMVPIMLHAILSNRAHYKKMEKLMRGGGFFIRSFEYKLF